MSEVSNGGHDRRSTQRRKKRDTNRKKLTLTIALLLVVGTFGGLGSWAAWVVSDTNTGNTFTTSTITLTDNQGGPSAGTALFNVTDLAPGSAATTRCIGVNIAGTAVASRAMTLSATLAGADAALLDDELTMDVAAFRTDGSAVTGTTNAGDCTGYNAGTGGTSIGTPPATLANWVSGHTTPATGYSIASPVTSTWYKFTVSGLDAGLDNDCATYCGKTITIALTWTLTAA